MAELPDYEKIGSFYLGKHYDLESRLPRNEKLLYDSKDLTTHAMCVGMTGSGKTGLCLSLLEEAALDGIPAICVDPKGDMGNLLLAFPELRPADFEPWVEPAEAARRGKEPSEYAAEVAESWKKGLEAWDQDADRVRRYVDSVESAIYTPGSNAGLPITVLRSFDPPPQEVMEDSDLLGERISGAASGLLALLDIQADPLSSPEHILLSNILDTCWRNGQKLDLPTLIRSIQNPPFEKVGVFDVDSFFAPAERMKLSMKLNNLLASPAFSGWLEGQALDIRQLLYSDAGKPKLSIISIAHLSDQERMFFVTILLNELLAWMRTQPGTSSLRALFYMDEVYGYFPPSAKPPSKPPMMLLLKQARAFGLGVVLATQNPVDLDYKGLSNIGTWFLGRLQTQRDKDRVLDGLEGVASQAGEGFQRNEMDKQLSALGKRVFLMNNVHDARPSVFQTRWAMSYLRGPLSRVQIQRLMANKRSEAETKESPTDTATAEPVGPSVSEADRPVIPVGVQEQFAIAAHAALEGNRCIYRPGLLAQVSCHYVRVSAGLDDWLDRTLLYATNGGMDRDVWRAATLIDDSLRVADEPQDGFSFAALPAAMLNAKNYKTWERELRDHLYRHVPVRIFHCPELKQYSAIGHDELDARLAWNQAIREQRDEERHKLRESYAAKVNALEDRIRTARQRLEREKAQYDEQKWSSVLSIGETVLGAFLGNKISRRSATAGRRVSKAAQQRTDVLHAEESLAELQKDKFNMEMEFEKSVQDLNDRLSVHAITLEPLDVPCRKGDLQIKELSLIWLPWEMLSDGTARPLY